MRSLYIWENKEAYSRMDSETKELLEVVAHVRIREEDKVMRNEEETYDLCKAFVDMKLEGVEEGRAEGEITGSQKRLIKSVCIKLRKNKSITVIADELEEEISEIEKVIAAQKRVGSYDVEQICKVLTEH